MIDTDSSGNITAEELHSLLEMQGEDVTMEDVHKIIGQIDQDTSDAHVGLNFKEFVTIMGDVEGKSTADLVSQFAHETKKNSSHFQAKDPLWKQMQDQANQDGGLQFSSTKNARMKLAQILDGNNTQIVIMILIALDVMAVMLEIVVHELYCPCHDMRIGHPLSAYGSGEEYPYRRLNEDEFESDRVFGLKVSKLSWDDLYSFFGYDTEYGYGESEEHRRLAGGMCPSQKQYEATIWLQCISLGILWMFAFQILGLIIVYNPVEFFSNFFYTLDFIVVYGALVLEMPYVCEPDEGVSSAYSSYSSYGSSYGDGRRLGSSYSSSYSSSSYSSSKKKVKNHDFLEHDDYGGLHFGCSNIAKEGALVTIILCWRVTRVIHGIFTSIELQQEKRHHAIQEKQDELVKTLVETRRNFAKKRFVHSKYHDNLQALGVKYIKEGGHHADEHAMDMEDVSSEELKKRLSEAERMYATLYMYVDAHNEDLKAAENKVKADPHGHGHGHGH